MIVINYDLLVFDIERRKVVIESYNQFRKKTGCLIATEVSFLLCSRKPMSRRSLWKSISLDLYDDNRMPSIFYEISFRMQDSSWENFF